MPSPESRGHEVSPPTPFDHDGYERWLAQNPGVAVDVPDTSGRDDWTVLEHSECGRSIGRSGPDGIWLKRVGFFRPDPEVPPAGEIHAYCGECRVAGVIDVAKVRANTGQKRRRVRVRIRRVYA